MAKKVVHTETEIERALAALAKNAGNAARAQRELTAAGHPVAYRTLADWKTRYAERYEDARRRYSKALEEQLAEEMTSEARENIEAARLSRERYLEDLKAGKVPGRDLAGAIRNLATASGIEIDKARVLQEKPTEYVEYRPGLVTEIDRILREAEVVDSTAEEVGPTQLERGERGNRPAT